MTAELDHRKRPRRRGETLNAAIFQATLDELAENGFAGLTMERVAERAQASKASLYRRWPSRIELVLAAVYDALAEATTTPDTGSLRGDLLTFHRQAAEQLAGPAGEALRGLLSDVLRDPERMTQLRMASRGRTREAMRGIVDRAANRGELGPGGITTRQLEAGPALLRNHFLFSGVPIPDDVIVEIVDEVLLPLFGVQP